MGEKVNLIFYFTNILKYEAFKGGKDHMSPVVTSPTDMSPVLHCCYLNVANQNVAVFNVAKIDLT